MFKFEHKTYDNTKVTIETESVCLTEILEEFGMFLKGCGFSFDGNIIIEDPNDYIEPVGADGYYSDEIDDEMVDLVQELSHTTSHIIPTEFEDVTIKLPDGYSVTREAMGKYNIKKEDS